MFKPIDFKAGVYADDAPLDAAGFYTDSNKIRFVRGRPQTIGGQEYASSSSMTGICRGAITWSDNNGLRRAAFGTHLRLYLMDGDGGLGDATPVVTRTYGSLNFTSSTGSATLLVSAYNNHGLSVDQKIAFANASTTGVAGVSIQGEWPVLTTESSSSFTIAMSSTAVSSTTAAISCDVSISLAPGLVNGLAGYGFGTGGYGVGGYGSSSSQSLFVRTWSLDTFGQNLLANPRGGGIYELAPGTSATELASTSSLTWTGATTVTYNQTVSVPSGAWMLLRYNVTSIAAGSLTATLAGSTVATSTSSGVTYGTVYSGAATTKTLAFAGSTATATVTGISFKALTTANLIPNAPGQVTSMFVTNERIVVACGCTKTDGTFDPMRVRWSDQEDNNDWTADPANFAGGYTLNVGTRIVRGLKGRIANGIFTDTGLISMTYTGNPNSIYRFDTLGTGCGLIGPNAVCELNGVWYWLSVGGEFYRYAGGTPEALQSTVRRYVWDNLAKVQQDKIYCFSVAQWSEIWWLYPDSRDGNECTRYVIYNTAENTWAVGTFDRTAFADAGVYGYPLGVDTSGRIYFQEKGFDDNGGPRSWSLTSGRLNAGTVSHLMGLKPNADDLQGGYQVTVTSYIPNDIGLITDTFGPYNVTSASGSIGTRATGEQFQIQWSATDGPSFFRMGAFQWDVRPSGAKR